MPKFELQIHTSTGIEIDSAECSLAAVKQRAGRITLKRRDEVVGVDIAYDDGRDWNDRYITTATADQYRATGFKFGRIE